VILGLIAGNAVILKPSEVTGLVNVEIQKIVDSMELPQDVFTMIQGRGDVGEALVRSGVDRLIVTGSVATGKKVMATAAETLTPVTLELGGKDSMIVLEDANLDVATSAAVTGSLYNAGQSCCSVERILVHESIADKFTSMMNEKIKKVRIDESTGFDNDMGPVTYELQKKVYLEQSQQFAKSGHKPLLGFPDYDGKTNFMRPLVVTGDDNLKFWTDETFGPVSAIRTFKNDDEAVELNNKSPYGLTGMIWTKDNQRARKIARRLNVGVVVINDAPFTNYVPSLPWGGVRESGFGWVHGELGLKEMCQAQVVVYDFAGQQKQFWWFPHSRAQYYFLKNYAILFDGKGFKTKFKAFLGLIKNLLAMGPRL
jgi:acyl-CoA reductase-like NAD-dependent aldehyde dehydrogenase